MKFFILVIISLFILQCKGKISERRKQFYALNNYTYIETKDGFDDSNPIKSRFLGGTEVDGLSVPWMVSIIYIDGERLTQYYGPGIIVNKYFVLCNSFIIDSLLSVFQTMVVSQSNEIGDFYPPAVFRRGKEVFYNFGTIASEKLGLIRVCPSFDSTYFAPIPVQPQVYAEGTSITLYNYSPRLKNVTKKIGPPSDCNYPAFTAPEEVICAASTPLVVEASDYQGAIAVIDGQVVGIVGARGRGGELITNISQFLTWINTHAVFNPQY